MDASSLVVGCTYYMLTFADVEQTMPGVRPMVYVGTEIRGEAPAEPTFYFQDTVSVSVRGSINGPVYEVQSGHEVDFQIFPFSGSGLAAVYELSELMEEMKGALSRAEALGFPRLARCKGKWITPESS